MPNGTKAQETTHIVTDNAEVKAYPKPAGGAPDFPELELEVLDYWASDDTFRANSTTSRLSVTPSMPGWVSEDIGEVAGIGEVIPMTVTSTNSV